MLSGAVAGRYAQAIFEIAMEKGRLEECLEALLVLAKALQEPEIDAVLDNPKVPLGAKRSLVHENLHELDLNVLHLAYLLIAKDRWELIDRIVQSYQDLLNAYRGIGVARVIAAVPLVGKEKARLADRLSVITGKKILLETLVDQRILGGLIIKIGDKMIDGSVSGRLRELRQELAG